MANKKTTFLMKKIKRLVTARSLPVEKSGPKNKIRIKLKRRGGGVKNEQSPSIFISLSFFKTVSIWLRNGVGVR